MNSNDKIVAAFIDESRELLQDLEGLLLDLENDPENRDNLDAVFRVMHTIKGSAGMVGYDSVNQFTHQIEDAFDMIRKGEKKFDSLAADSTLIARDIILTLLENRDESNEALNLQMKEVVGLLSHQKENPVPHVMEKEVETKDIEFKTYKIEFKPGPDVFLRGINLNGILDELLKAGDCTISTLMDKIPNSSAFKPEKCYFYWQILLTTDKSLKELREIFMFVEAESQIDISDLNLQGNSQEIARLGDILKNNGLISEEDLSIALGKQKKLGEVLLEEHKLSEDQLHSALREQEHLKNQEIKGTKHNITSSIRVSTGKLDKFVDLVGELVTLQAQLDQNAQRIADMELGGVSERLQTLIEDLRDTALGIRMIPIGDTFSSFRRLVRDLSGQLGKSIRLEFEGGETELDKTVIDRLHDPLMHLIRNSIDHGIENPQTREKAGKDKTGTIMLKAKHSGGNVIISIEDDGGGLSKERILEKAISKGLIGADQKVRDEDVYKLIFNSGFSTAQAVSKVSGRGVGMDVVKKEIDNLGGHISLDSREGEYTHLHFTLPLTLAIIDGLLVKLDDDHYVIPLASVESCLELDEVKKQMEESQEGEVIYYREKFLPYINLRNFLNYPEKEKNREQLVVIRTEDSFYGLVVDQVIGDHQTVIKNLGKLFRQARAYSGATIMGSGDVALILNVATLAQLSKENREVS